MSDQFLQHLRNRRVNSISRRFWHELFYDRIEVVSLSTCSWAVSTDYPYGCNSETDVSRGALAGKGDDIVRDGDFSTIGVGE